MTASAEPLPVDQAGWRSLYLRFCDWSYGQTKQLFLRGLRNSQYAYLNSLRRALTGSGRWLDLGCGHGFVPSWVEQTERQFDLRRWRVVGVDLDLNALRRHPDLEMRIYGNVERLPFADAAFSRITANMVLEHVERPDLLFAELRRVLAPGGTLLVHTPNAAGYTTRLTRMIPERLLSRAAAVLLGREAEDVYPTFYRVNSDTELARLARVNSLDVLSVDHVTSSPQFIRIPPLMFLEMLWLRLLETRRYASYRPCIIGTFRANQAALVAATPSLTTAGPVR